MTLFQCRRFQFFDLEKVDLDISIKEHLKGSTVRCGSSGRGRILVGDSEGAIQSISRQLETKTVAQAHMKGILQIEQLKQSAYVVTLGEDEPGLHSIKIWDGGPAELDQSKTQLVLKKVIRFSRPKPPTCFAVHESLTLLAVGFEDGEIQLYRGELTREKNIRARIIHHEGEQGMITGLSFKTLMKKNIILFAAAKNAIIPFDVTTRDKEMKFQGDKSGCDMYCSCVADGSAEDHFIVGRSDAVYCFTHEGRGPCYGFDGEKHMLYFFRGYLVIISRISSETYGLTIFDCANKFVAFSSSLLSPEPINVAASEWGSLYLLTSDGTFWQLKEKDLQTKMNVFYKKNHYDLAIKVAKNNNFDAEGMADIYRQHGDHLYNKGDLDGAIKQYCKTVGKIVPSYVVRKYLDASRVLNLLEYLEFIHKEGHATPDLTTLLLNCLTKLKLNEKIEHYVKDPSCDFLEPETAIQVFRKGGMSKQAYQLAQKHELYGNALQILLEDVRDPCKEDLYEILEKVVQDEKAEEILKRYGSSLVQLVGQADPKATDAWKKIVSLLCQSPVKRELVDLFISKKDILVPLLEDICQEFQASDGSLMNLLLEAYLDHWSKKTHDISCREKILALLSKAPNCPTWDWPRALLACKMAGFSTGEIIAYEKLGLHNDLLEIRYRAALRTPALWTQFQETCNKYAKNKPTLWKDAFFLITTPYDDEDPDAEAQAKCPTGVVEEILMKLLEDNLMEPLPILDRLCETRFKLGSARSFLAKVLDRKDITEDEKECQKLLQKTDEVRQRIEAIETKPSTFQSTRCNACSQELGLPSVHFLCLHSFHQHCFDSYAANEMDCPVCWHKNKDIIGSEIAERRPSKAAVDADFAVKLSSARSNSFSVLAEFFSKGLFKSEEETNRERSSFKRPIEKLRVPTTSAFESSNDKVTEARLRLHEGSVGNYISTRQNSAPPIESYLETVKSSRGSQQQFTQDNRRSPALPPKQGSNLPFPRVQTGAGGPPPPLPPKNQESPRSSTRKPMMKPPVSISAAVQQHPQSSSKRNKAPEPKNPFEDDEDLGSNNPFGEQNDQPAEPKNPFEEDDYDSSMNPFAE